MSLTVLVLFLIFGTVANILAGLVLEVIRPRLVAMLNPPRPAAVRARKVRGPAVIKLRDPPASDASQVGGVPRSLFEAQARAEFEAQS